IDNLSEFVGSVGERRDFDLTITRSSSFEGDYGVTYVYEMVDGDNNSLVWFASNPLHRKVPDEAEMAQNAELVEAGRKIFEERILPAGGTLEGLIAVNAHTIGTRIYNARQTMDIPEADIARTRELVNGTG